MTKEKENIAMTKEKDLPARFQTPGEEPFPFFELPEVVHWKILREYVPVLTKARALGQLPEFSRLLRDRSCWTNVSDEYAQVVSILSKLREGLYVASDSFPHRSYYVGTSDYSVTFTLCSVTDRMFQHYPDELDRFGVFTPACNLRDFLKCFLKRYELVEQSPLLVYRFGIGRIFVRNPITNVVMWTDGATYAIKNNKCEISKPYINYYNSDVLHLIFDDKNTVSFQYYDKLEPISLESHILHDGTMLSYEMRPDWDEGSIPVGKKLCQFEISLKGRKELFVHISTPALGFCRWYNDHELFNILSKDISLKVSESCL